MKEERVNLLYSRIYYATDKPHMSRIQTDEFKYPCVYTIGMNGNLTLCYSSTNNNGHFGIPKLIWTNGASVPIIDYTGEYGLTQFAYSIIENVDKLPLIQQAMLSEKFITMMSWSNGTIGKGNHKYNHQLIKLFRKDFWKYFL